MAEINEAPEAKWLKLANPDEIFRRINHVVTPRERHLFACACCRHMLSLLPRLRLSQQLALAESCVEGEVERSVVREQGRAARCDSVGVDVVSDWAKEAIRSLCDGQLYEPCHHAARALRDQARGRDWSAAMKQQVTILCDLLGHLLHPTVRFDPAWLRWNDGTVGKMADAIYRDNTFGDVPILADALEEAGCENPVILHHCRAKMRHYRGCWVVDALLDKK
jgi:hypothetical protein